MKNNIYILEFTDNYINIYNSKKHELYTECIEKDIIKDNKIYDINKLILKTNKIVNKYKLINNIFKPYIYILSFDNISPTEEYLYHEAFKYFNNFFLRIINAFDIIKKANTVIISGNIAYLNKEIININTLKGKNRVVGFNYAKYIKDIDKNKFVEYENGNTILYTLVK